MLPIIGNCAASVCSGTALPLSLYNRHWVKPKPRESTWSVAFNASQWTFISNWIKIVVDQPRGGPLCIRTWTQFCGSRGEGVRVSAVGAGRLSWGNMVELNSVCAVTLSVMIIWAELGWKNTPLRTGLKRFFTNKTVKSSKGHWSQINSHRGLS